MKIQLNWNGTRKLDQTSNMDGTHDAKMSGCVGIKDGAKTDVKPNGAKTDEEDGAKTDGSIISSNKNNFHSINDDTGNIEVIFETWEPLRYRNKTNHSMETC